MYNESIILCLNKAHIQSWKTKKYSYLKIDRPDHGLLYLLGGEITYRFKEGEINLKPGDIVYLPKGSNYDALFSAPKTEVTDFLINFDLLSEKSVFDFDVPALLFSDSRKTIKNDFAELTRAYSDGKSSLLCQALLYKCVYSVFSAYKAQNTNKETKELYEIAAVLSSDFKISIGEITHLFNISRSTLQKKFYGFFGCSPSQYRIERQIEKAKTLLEATDAPIKEIALKSGFYDTAYFYKVFKKHTLVTPLEYRGRSL